MVKAAQLNIGADESGGSVLLPYGAYDDAVAITGRRGRGKSTTASVVVEELHDAGRRFCILDPTGVWHGLRSSADGKEKGIPVVVMGGEHGDVPLESRSGKLIAEFVADPRNPSTVLDLSAFDDGESETFCNDFLRHLYKVNRHRLHPVFDECQYIAPETPDSPQAHRMKKAAGKVFQMGRAHGLLPILITPRPASVSKDCLYACGMMIVHQLSAPAEQDALKKWVKSAGTAEQIAAFQESLAKLPVGVAWVWSPDTGIFKKVHVRARETFDSSKTAAGGSRTPKVRADVDLDKLRAAIGETIKRAEENDPAALRQRLAVSEAKVKLLESRTAPVEVSAKVIEKPVTEAQLQRAVKAARKGDLASLQKLVKLLGSSIERAQALKKKMDDQAFELGDYASYLGIAKTSLDEAIAELQKPPALEIVHSPVSLESHRHLGSVSSARTTAPVTYKSPVAITAATPPQEFDGEPITGPEQRLLNAIAWWTKLGIDAPSNEAVAVMAMYSVSSSSFGVPRAKLTSRGLIEYASGTLRLTSTGSGFARVDIELSNAAIQERALSNIDGPEKRLLEPLLKVHPNGMSNDELAAAAKYAATSSSYGVPRAKLKSLGLIKYEGGIVTASDILFPL